MKINMNDLRIILQQAERKLRVDENFLKSALEKGKVINEDKFLKNVNKDIQRVKPVIERINDILSNYNIDIEDDKSDDGWYICKEDFIDEKYQTIKFIKLKKYKVSSQDQNYVYIFDEDGDEYPLTYNEMKKYFKE